MCSTYTCLSVSMCWDTAMRSSPCGWVLKRQMCNPFKAKWSWKSSLKSTWIFPLWCDFAVKIVGRYTRGKIRSSLKYVDSKSLGKVLTHVCNINNVTPSNELKKWLIPMSSKDRTLLQVSIKTYSGAGAKAQRLQTLSTFPEDSGS